MIRSALLVCSLALLTSAGVANLGNADELESEPASEDAQPREDEETEDREEWREQLLTANQEIAIAQKRIAAAHQAYKTMRHRRRPRGEGKQAIMDEIENSREGLATAQQELEELERAARRAGAPRSWLKFDPAEINAATQAPAAQEP
jgi:chromosome segregation ATPase